MRSDSLRFFMNHTTGIVNAMIRQIPNLIWRQITDFTGNEYKKRVLTQSITIQYLNNRFYCNLIAFCMTGILPIIKRILDWTLNKISPYSEHSACSQASCTMLTEKIAAIYFTTLKAPPIYHSYLRITHLHMV